MKKLLLFLATVSCMVANVNAQQEPSDSAQQSEVYESIYQVSLQSMPEDELLKINSAYRSSLSKYEDSQDKAIGSLIIGSVVSTYVQKTANASSSLINLGVNYLTEAAKKGTKKYKFDQWYQSVSKANTFNMILADKETIDDFYYSPSSIGALDPSDIKFNGFVCQNVLTPKKSGKRATGENLSEPTQPKVKGLDAKTPDVLGSPVKTCVYPKMSDSL